MPAPLFQVVLHEPEVPNNTGNIGRTCIVTGCSLHLIRPLGFETSEKACRRAGLDYWPRLAPVEHDSWDDFERTVRPARVWLFTTKAARTVGEVQLEQRDTLAFGKETRGLPDALLARYPDRLVTLPMRPGERSLNLATAVCAAVYLGIDQLIRRARLTLDAHGRLPAPPA